MLLKTAFIGKWRNNASNIELNAYDSCDHLVNSPNLNTCLCIEYKTIFQLSMVHVIT